MDNTISNRFGKRPLLDGGEARGLRKEGSKRLKMNLDLLDYRRLNSAQKLLESGSMQDKTRALKFCIPFAQQRTRILTGKRLRANELLLRLGGNTLLSMKVAWSAQAELVNVRSVALKSCMGLLEDETTDLSWRLESAGVLLNFGRDKDKEVAKTLCIRTAKDKQLDIHTRFKAASMMLNASNVAIKAIGQELMMPFANDSRLYPQQRGIAQGAVQAWCQEALQ